MGADVTQRGSAQERIGDGVQQHISVRVTQQAKVIRHFHTTQNKLPPFDQCVNVPAFTDSEIHRLNLMIVIGKTAQGF
jgi:hypothetical protein